jgi:hypothetical protein
MKKIGIELNGVLRDTLEKFKQVYEKHLIDHNHPDLEPTTYEIDLSGNTEVIEGGQPFKYEIIGEPTSLELDKHFAFQNKEELYSFMFEEYTMELFGHAPSTEINTFNLLNDLYYDLRDKFDLLIVSDEIGKSKPASLFFLAKFGCLLEKVVFYSESTKDRLWNEVDILLTSNPDHIQNKPENKTVIKFNTKYNQNVISEFEISTLSDFKLILSKIEEQYA